MTTANLSQIASLRKGKVFLLFFALEAMVFAIIPLSAQTQWMDSLLIFHACVTVAFLACAWLIRRSERGKEYWPVFYFLFAAGMAVLVSTLFSGDLIRLFGFATITTPQGIAMAKFSESFFRVTGLLILMAIAGADFGSVYLRKGNLRLGLGVGIPAFVILAGIAFLPLASQEGTLDKLAKLLPWILLFVLSNGFMEELLYRGLFLKGYEPFLGKRLSNLLTAIVFTLIHAQVTYVSDVLLFLLIVFPLALVWGYLMQKTDSLWGPAIFHAGADCLIIFGIFTSMQ